MCFNILKGTQSNGNSA